MVSKLPELLKMSLNCFSLCPARDCFLEQGRVHLVTQGQSRPRGHSRKDLGTKEQAWSCPLLQ